MNTGTGTGPDHRFYGRRKSRPLKPRQQALLRDLLPAIQITPDDAAMLAAPSRLFAPPPEKMALEIGFGGGEHLAHQAKIHPDWGFIGCEPFVNGVAKLLSAIEDNNLDNIRVWDEDARGLLPLLGAETLARVFVLYPDPWPKKRHHRRRFINGRTLTGIHRLLEPGGELFFASDIPHYVAWTLAHVRDHGGFEWLAEGPADWREPPGDWLSTRYEQKALKAGRTPAYLRFVKA